MPHTHTTPQQQHHHQLAQQHMVVAYARMQDGKQSRKEREGCSLAFGLLLAMHRALAHHAHPPAPISHSHPTHKTDAPSLVAHAPTTTTMPTSTPASSAPAEK